MDEALRDAYNRFGASALVFDPRKDEMKLITDTSMGYIFWAVCAYLATLPTGVRAARNWIAIIGIIILSVEVCFSLTETTIPSWMPEYLTEADLVYYLHALFPMLIAFLCVLADYLYVDPDKTALAVLKEMTENQKVKPSIY